MAKLTRNQVRCEDCPNLKIEKGVWTCEECFGQLVEEIDDCPEGVTTEQIEELDKKAKETKIDHGAKTTDPKKKVKSVPKPKVASDEKQKLFSTVLNALQTEFGENVEIAKENKLIFVQIGQKRLKIDFVEQRPPKK